MPYIKQEIREKLDTEIDPLIDKLRSINWSAGELNYTFSKIIWSLFYSDQSYQRINDITGCLEQVKLEFTARHVRPYEDSKIEVNGDVDIKN